MEDFAGSDSIGPRGGIATRPAPVDVASYLDLMSSFPTGVSVVTTVDSEGRPQGMTCTSLTSVTVSPPTLLVCLRIDSATLRAVRHSGAFAVNLLHCDSRPAAELFASPCPDRFDRVRWRRSEAGLPWLVDEAFAIAECRVQNLLDVGEHTVVLGTVAALAQDPATPLLYGLRQFSTWLAPVGAQASTAGSIRYGERE
jgi:flavin reductase (DIM6/NTAB) family NADH-FMN oxidoreductase RutF